MFRFSGSKKAFICGVIRTLSPFARVKTCGHRADSELTECHMRAAQGTKKQLKNADQTMAELQMPVMSCKRFIVLSRTGSS